MKKRNALIIFFAGLILLAGLLFFSKAAVFKKSSGAAESTRSDQNLAVHEGHATGGEKNPNESREEAEEEAPTVEIPVEKQQLLGVKTTEVSVRPLEKIIRTVGKVEYDERRIATVNTKLEGWIEKLYVDYTGRYVNKGEPLAEIYSPELMATQQEFLNVLKWASKSEGRTPKAEIEGMLDRDAGALVEAAKQRLRLWDISDAQIRKIEESGRPIRTFTIYSPVSGYVVQKMALQGMKVMAGEKLFDVADLATVWIISDIYEYEMSMIKTGETARIRLSYLPGREFSSKIDYIYPSLSGETRTAKVRFSISNPGGQLKPQMYTNVEVRVGLGKKLAIPDDAVLDTGTRQIVYVDKGDGYFEPREVMLGQSAEGFREVVMGLKAGEKVVSSATFLIDSESQLKGVKPLGGHKH